VRRRRYGRPSPVCGATLSDVDSPETSTPPSGRHGWDRRQIAIAAVCAAVILAFGTVLTVGLMNRGVNNSIKSAIAKGQRVAAPQFSDPVLTSAPGIPAAGQRLSLAQLRGHPVVLNIWASWCTPCIDEAPILQSVWDRYRARGVYVLGVDVKDLTGDALNFHQSYGLTYPTLRDGEGSIEGPYGVTGVPESFIIDRNGRIAAAVPGPLSSSGSSGNLASFLVALDSVIAEPAGTG
jgi:cytochrome c biogenesis protein CcmG/thiol:disulfide interchange protein DsbE